MENKSTHLIIRPLIFCLISVTFLLLPAIFTDLSHSYAQTNQHIKYYGYYWGINDLSDNVAHSNVGFVVNTWKATSLQNLIDKDIESLNRLNSLKLKGILDLSRVFFDQKNGNSLRPNWQTRWDTYWQAIKPHIENIAALYPIDEPDGRVTMQDYALVTKAIKAKTTSTQRTLPILMVVTPSGALKIKEQTLSVPPEVDWLGFDEYNCWGSDCYQGVSIPNKFQAIIDNAKSHPGRQVVIVPDAMYHGKTIPSTQIQQEKANALQNYYQLCQTEPSCVAILPFLWSTLPNVENGLIGAQDMPVLKRNLISIGKIIKSNSKTFPSDLNADGSVNIFDYNLLVAGFGTKYDIFDYNELVANYGK